MEPDLIRKLIKPADTRVILLVIDGLGGLPMEEGGLTELEAAKTPNLDDLATRSICGLHQPLGPGITPGSGPAHQALFGYDPIKFHIGRGVLAAVGIGFDLNHGDVVARGNFCSVDEEGRITDRRAGRISSEKNGELCKLLSEIELPGVEVFVKTVKGYRFLLALRGEGLSSDITDTDSQVAGDRPLQPQPLSQKAEKTVRLVRQFLDQAGRILANHYPANMILLRGFATGPSWPQINDLYGLKAIAIADYPMYRGVAGLIGMDTVDPGNTTDRKIDILRERWHDYNFFFVHIKQPDIAGEDGDFYSKVAGIEHVDAKIAEFMIMKPDVMIVTGDHSTPSLLLEHSWHPVPVLLWSKYCRPDGVDRFGERACINGGLGPRFPTTDLMPIALAHAMRLKKFGA
ncbi:cofactor-independent phosphoglycerate mutase [bacterium BMS3Abin07]|nr:cofactor-independent phosphoglycerate mutase [bacterium BMS3Abin07]GBE31925.1 cofactor-independent phosphoglycerate mutase [bacterium BMS3Bbin05]HDL21147.1 2,3-bisphosphoglycerate-independent phosphoglycerate mutase [Nitrospirota bacterium]HDO23350.1 2,3-bisphosphoglycerate-independent phosphoglycerate mutase [Nitrospirota bacterium]HDZ87709.1 2,3-bisphosphoglycerate-independent phosphoglycerate mutase [Nitrospirota bacterium]